ncbi:MAG: hypothetical protein HPY64_09975 [Anaerolineae bacterium]|nr:hypothetical protein [Anaerolineae bacterium]
MIRILTTFLAILLAILVLMACQPAPPPYPGIAPWSDGLLIGQARRLDAPAAAWNGQAWLAAWADASTLFARQVWPEQASATPSPLLTDRQPWAPVLLPATDGEWHLLWNEVDSFEQTHLFSAHLQADSTLSRGPMPVTADATGSSAAALDGSGGVIILWVATGGDRPVLYGQQLDAQSRPLAGPAPLVAPSAEYPALARTAEGRWVMAWLALPDSPHNPADSRDVVIQISESVLPWQEPGKPVIIGRATLSDPALYIESVALGLDRSFGYLFVNRRDARNYAAQTEVYSFPLSGGESSLPANVAPLLVRFPAAASATSGSFTTGFNTGPALVAGDVADPANLPAGGAYPVQGQHEVLPVAFTADRRLIIGYFQGGVLAAYQNVATAPGAIGGLNLSADRDRHLTIAWTSLPHSSEDPASLLLSTTRPISAPSTRP